MPPKRFDAGIVASDRRQFVCWPLVRFDIESGEMIKSISTSCDCVRASVVSFQSTNASQGDGMQFEFVPEESDVTSNLAIEIRVDLYNEESLVFTLAFTQVSKISSFRP